MPKFPQNKHFVDSYETSLDSLTFNEACKGALKKDEKFKALNSCFCMKSRISL